MAANAREARRRKILERGSDRLALITGWTHTLQPPPPPSYSLPSGDDADSLSQPLIADDQAIRPLVSYPNTTVSAQGEAEESDPILLKAEPVTDPYHSSAYNGSSQTPLHEFEQQNVSSLPTSVVVEQVQQLPGSSVVTSEVNQVQPPPDSSVRTSGTEQQLRLQSRDTKFFTPGEISSAITASKITRLCCSICVALLVVLSYLGFPLLHSRYVKSVLSFRPLYLVLVTNVTVVAVQLFTGKQRRVAGRQNEISSDGNHWIERLSRALESVLVMRNVMDAMFMDCASYAIIVICGLSFL
ncbi:hypothetical protein K1719_025609 [Acacia pycnantha]|nr:hypothetical protein K1719_025609 [Acacia pycnantha]